MDSIPGYTIDSVKDLQSLVDGFGMSADFVYRGQKLSYVNLTSSLERHVDNDVSRKYLHKTYGEIGFSNLYSLEHQIIREFQAGVHHYSNTPPDTDFLQWLALMQHHGAPTRLLDVTRSVFVALYFAVSHEDDVDGVVYSFLTLEWFYQKQPYEPKYTKPNRYLRSAFQDLLSQPPSVEEQPLGVIHAKPRRLNRRQIAQQGEFLMPLRVDHSFEDNLRATHALDPGCPEFNYGDERVPCHSNPVIRYIIPRSSFSNIRLALTHMNVTGASLFPDLDGFARSMHEVARQWRGGNY